MHLCMPSAPVEGVVVSNERCTASKKSAGFVRHVAIDVSGTPLSGRFIAGQSFGVIPPGTDAKGVPHKVRLYSIASPTAGEDGRGAVLATTVKRLIDEDWVSGSLYLGVASNYLCDRRPGDRVKVSGPNGKRFVLPARADEHDYVFFATGTGIAPFRGMLGDLYGTPAAPGTRRPRVTLVMGSPYASDLLYHEQLLDLARREPAFTYLPTLSREKQTDGSPAAYVQDRLSTHRDLFGPMLASDRALVYICGVAGMELGIFQGLARYLPADARKQYLDLDPDAASDPTGWTRRMIHKQVRPTRRVFLEVY